MAQRLSLCSFISACLFLLTTLAWGLEAFSPVSNIEEQSPMLKTEGSAPPFPAGHGISMRVLWTITEYKAAKGAVWGEEEARRLLFKPLDMDATRITFDGQTCQAVIFKRESVNTKRYLRRVYHTTPQALGINEETVEVVKTNCTLPGFREYIRLKDRRLVIHINGVFFYFEPAVSY